MVLDRGEDGVRVRVRRCTADNTPSAKDPPLDVAVQDLHVKDEVV